MSQTRTLYVIIEEESIPIVDEEVDDCGDHLLHIKAVALRGASVVRDDLVLDKYI